MQVRIKGVILHLFHFEQTPIGKQSTVAGNTRMQGSAMSNLCPPDQSFDPEVTHAMGMAFDSAWQDLEASGNIFSPCCTKDWARNTIAARIIDTAGHGEHDPHRLSNDALAHLAQLVPPMPDQWAAVVSSRAGFEIWLRQLGAV